MFFKKPDWMTKQKWEFIRNHEKPNSRRQFLGLGLVSGFTAVTPVSVLTSLHARAQGQGACPMPSGAFKELPVPPLFEFHASGGYASPQYFVHYPSNSNRDLSAFSANAAARLGYSSGLRSDQASFLAPFMGMEYIQTSHFGQALSNALAGASIPGVGLNVIHTTANDSSDNKMSLAQLHVEFCKNIVNASPMLAEGIQSSGYRHQSVIELPLNGVRIQNQQQINNLINLGRFNEHVSSKEAKDVIAKYAKQLHSHQFGGAGAGGTAAGRGIASASIEAQVRDAIKCGYLKANHSLANLDANAFDANQDPDIITCFGPANNRPRDLQRAALSAFMLANGHALTACQSEGGYDYHDGSFHQNEQQRLGRVIGSVARYFQMKGKPLVISITSDGGCSGNTNGREDNNLGMTVNQNEGGPSMGSRFIYIGDSKIMPGVTFKEGAGCQIGEHNLSNGAQISAAAPYSTEQFMGIYLLNLGNILGKLSETVQLLSNHGISYSQDDLQKLVRVEKGKAG